MQLIKLKCLTVGSYFYDHSSNVDQENVYKLYGGQIVALGNKPC